MSFGDHLVVAAVGDATRRRVMTGRERARKKSGIRRGEAVESAKGAACFSGDEFDFVPTDKSETVVFVAGCV